MRTFTTSYIALLNQLEGQTWAFTLDLTVNVNSVAYFTSHPETLSSAGNIYRPVPFVLGSDDQPSGGELPQLIVGVSNYDGQAFAFAKDNDLSLNDVTIRLVNVGFLTDSGALTKRQILSSVFDGETAQFTLGYNFNYDVEGPRRTFNRTDFPSIPYNTRQFAFI
jgi:hypothetical protein